MGLDGEVSTPEYVLKDGQLYVRSLGGLQPMTTGDGERRLAQHRHETEFYKRAEPERSKRNIALGNELEALLQEQAAGHPEK